MNRPFDRMIEEKLMLSQCVKGDELDVAYCLNGGWKTIGRIILDKIKPLPKGAFQLKYHSTYHSVFKIKKVMVPRDIQVRRFRIANDSDGPEAVTPVPERLTPDRIDYLLDAASSFYQERLSERYPKGITKSEFVHRLKVPRTVDTKSVSDTVRRMLTEILERRVWNNPDTTIVKGDDPCPTKLVNKD